jgi:hypothetical protein
MGTVKCNSTKLQDVLDEFSRIFYMLRPSVWHQDDLHSLGATLLNALFENGML